jgi:DNA phosphorothioation-associated putative methyltransferase
VKVRPENTAIPRSGASKPLRDAVAQGWLHPGDSVLDFGCGRGADVRWLRQNGYVGEGYDPHEPFGWNRQPEQQFDVVLVIYVVNVLGSAKDRVEALAASWAFVKPRGAMLVVSRDRHTIDQEAAAGGWPRWQDGYWSNQRRGMFQRGHTIEDLEDLVASLGECTFTRSPARGYAAILVNKPGVADTSVDGRPRP